MSKFHTEMNIPVNRDNRTFEQRRKDMFTSLERRTSTRRNEQPNSDTVISDPFYGSSSIRTRDDWDREVDRWINESRRRFNEEIRRMKEEAFALEPVDDFDMDPWGTELKPFEPIGDHSSMMAKMEREMQAIRDQMSSMSPIGSSSRIPLTGGTSIQSSSSKYTTSTTTSRSGDPKSTKTQSNVQESVKHSRTVNGVTTGTTSHSSVSRRGTGPESKQLLSGSATKPGALIEPSSPSGLSTNFFSNAYELDEDGQVHFKVRFNAKDFSPEDIEVTTVENKLTVHAKKHIKQGDSETSKEFCRTIELPRTIDHEHFRCNLTEDGVLILDAPVKTPDYESLTIDDGQHLGIRPKSELQLRSSGESVKPASMVPIGASEPTIIKDGANGRKLRLEVPVQSIYAAEDLCVRVDANSLIVNGKHTDSASVTEFTRTFEIPEAVDPFTVKAQLIGTTLLIEAPLLS